MRYITLFVVLFVGSLTLQAQPSNKPTAETMLRVANEQFEARDYYRAFEWYDKYYEITKDASVFYNLAVCLMNDRDYEKAEKAFGRMVASKKIKQTDYPELRFHNARMMKMNSKYDDALAEFEEFMKTATDARLKALATSEMEGIKLARTLRPAEGVTVTNQLDKINGMSGDYSPSQADNGNLYFTSFRGKEIIVMDGKQKDNAYSQVYQAKKTKQNWGDAKPLETDVNMPGAQHGNVFVTGDGNYLYFTRVTLTGNVPTESTLFVSKKQGSGWGPAKEVGGLTGKFVKNPSVGELFSKEVIYFSSNMEGGKGGFDLYYATKKSDGSYDLPTNLGSVINGMGDEVTPFYRDGKLYFSSTTHPGIGGEDVFVSTWNGGEWSKPTNMGMGYNSAADDKSFSVSADGYHGWLQSNREGTRSIHSKTCCDDLWEVSLVQPTIGIEALVVDKAAKAVNGASMQLVEMTGGAMGVTDTKKNDKGNNFGWPLAFEKTYALVTTCTGFYADTTLFNTQGITKTFTVKKTIALTPLPKPVDVVVVDTIVIESGEPIRLEKIYYDYNSDVILSDAMIELDYLDTLMIQNPTMVIELSSHTDARGSDDYNQKLSQRRAENARAYMISRGIAPERIKAVGYGETQILNQCANGVECSDEDHRYNRRTEAKIIAGPTSIKITRKEFSTRTVKAGKEAKGSTIIKQDAPTPPPAPTPKQTPKTGTTTTPGTVAAPAVAPKPAAKTGMPAMTFDKKLVEFGRIKKGEKRENIYSFTNTGDVPLNIDIVSGCDCTTLTWTETTVLPGGKGFVKAIFDSAKAEPEDLGKALVKDITIVLKENNPANGYPIVEELSFKVFVAK